MTDEGNVHGELEAAREQVDGQLRRERVRSGMMISMADWWRDQREQNNFRVLLEDLLTHRRG